MSIGAIIASISSSVASITAGVSSRRKKPTHTVDIETGGAIEVSNCYFEQSSSKSITISDGVIVSHWPTKGREPLYVWDDVIKRDKELSKLRSMSPAARKALMYNKVRKLYL